MCLLCSASCRASLSWLSSVLGGCSGGVESTGDGMNLLGLTELAASFFVSRIYLPGERKRLAFRCFWAVLVLSFDTKRPVLTCDSIL